MHSYFCIKQFWPFLFLSLRPVAHWHQSNRNAVGNALASLDTFNRFYVHLSSPRLKEKVRENSHWDCRSESFAFVVLISTFSDTLPVWGGNKTHTRARGRYQWFTKAPTTIRGSEIGNGYFQQLPDVSGDVKAKQLSQLSKEIMRRKCGNEKWLIFLLKLQRVVMVA